MEDTKPTIKTEPTPARHNGNRYRGKKKSGKTSSSASSFKGHCPELAGYVYTYDAGTRADQYDKTTEFIAEYMKRGAEFPDDLSKCMFTRTDPDINSWKPKARVLTEEERNEERDNPEVRKLNESIMSEEVKEYAMLKRKFRTNKCHAFTLVLGQCSAALKAKLSGYNNWENIKHESNLVELLKAIKVLMINHQDTCYPMLSAYNATLNMLKLYQFQNESLEDYRTKFEAAVEVVGHIGVDLPMSFAKFAAVDISGGTAGSNITNMSKAAEAEVLAYERFLAVAFIRGANKERYGAIMTHYENMYSNGTNQYPANITEAYNRLTNWKRDKRTNETPYNDGMAFAQSADAKNDEKKPGQDRTNDVCHACGKTGHHAWERKCKRADLIAKADTLNAMYGTADGEEPSSASDKDSEPGGGSDGADGGNAKESADGREGGDAEGVCNAMVADAADDKADALLEAFEYAFCTSNELAGSGDTGYVHGQDGMKKMSVTTNSFSKERTQVIPKGSIGLDSMSSVDLFGDRHLLTEIATVPDQIRIVCNAGAVTVNQMGMFRGYGRVWYHPGAIANILSLSNVQSLFRVTYDNRDGDYFLVHRTDGTARIFEPTSKGLYVSEIIGTRREAALVNTVKQNRESYTKREYNRAKEARRLMTIIGRPSERQMREIVNKRLIPNCMVTEQDIINASQIFGPDVGALKGKTGRTKEPHVSMEVRPIPPELMERHREVVLCIDVMYVNNIAFLVSVSRAIRFCTAEALANRRNETLLVGMSRIKAAYSTRGFMANRVLADNEFEVLRPGLAGMGVLLNCVARDEHVPEVERHIRTVKERCRAIYNTLPFQRIPARMITELVYNVTFWLNAFPVADGVSATRSPRELIYGTMLDARRHCVLPFGAYVQTHEEHDNSMATRTIGAIALRPSGNAQGAHYFMSLTSVRRLIRNKWTEVPMPEDVVVRVNKLAGNTACNRLVFGDRENSETHEQISSDDDAEADESESDDDDEGSLGADGSDDGHDGDDGGNGADAGDRNDEICPHHEAAEQQAAEERDTDGHEDHGDGTGAGETGTRQETTQADDEARAEDAHESGWELAPAEARERRVHFAPDAGIAESNVESGHTVRQIKQEPGSEMGRTEAPAIQGTGDHVAQHVENQDGNTENGTGDSNSGTGTGSSAQITGVPGVRTGNVAADSNDSVGGEAMSAEMDMRYGPRQAERGLRPRRKPRCDYTAPQRPSATQIHHPLETTLAQQDKTAVPPSYNVANLAEISPSLEPLLGTILTQYGVNRGLKLFGANGEEAVLNELRQLHEREVLHPRSGRGLSSADRRAALQYLMFLKQKRNGLIKGRGCADGRKQRAYVTKDETSSPTISTEAVLLIATIAAKERRDVATVDIPGAFMQTDLDGEHIMIKFEGRMAELMAMVDPSLYRPHIMIEHGKPVLYAVLKKVLYGMLQAALKFWRQITADLISLDYTVNPYDWCVANKIVNGKQHTVGWHVDDFLMSHEDADVNSQLIEWFQNKYGRISPLTVHRGSVHEYLGMTLDFTICGAVRISMCDYVDGIIKQAPADWTGSANTPAANHLFDINANCPGLDKDRAALFHHLVAKALFLCKRARPDLQLAISFLCTRVKSPDEDDWAKLRRFVLYLRATRDLDLTLEADATNVVKWWVDAAYAVHADLKSHTGGSMSLGSGMIYSSSTRQKLNTKSSTEAELVGAGDLMPQVLWTRYFLQVQGYSVDESVMYQDNKSAILLEQNGKGSSSKRTRHINIRYFFITDRIEAGEVTVEHCPTEKMVADYFTKPLQGTKFQNFRNTILNLRTGK